MPGVFSRGVTVIHDGKNLTVKLFLFILLYLILTIECVSAKGVSNNSVLSNLVNVTLAYHLRHNYSDVLEATDFELDFYSWRNGLMTIFPLDRHGLFTDDYYVLAVMILFLYVFITNSIIPAIYLYQSPEPWRFMVCGLLNNVILLLPYHLIVYWVVVVNCYMCYYIDWRRIYLFLCWCFRKFSILYSRDRFRRQALILDLEVVIGPVLDNHFNFVNFGFDYHLGEHLGVPYDLDDDYADYDYSDDDSYYEGGDLNESYYQFLVRVNDHLPPDQKLDAINERLRYGEPPGLIDYNGGDYNDEPPGLMDDYDVPDERLQHILDALEQMGEVDESTEYAEETLNYGDFERQGLILGKPVIFKNEPHIFTDEEDMIMQGIDNFNSEDGENDNFNEGELFNCDPEEERLKRWYGRYFWEDVGKYARNYRAPITETVCPAISEFIKDPHRYEERLKVFTNIDFRNDYHIFSAPCNQIYNSYYNWYFYGWFEDDLKKYVKCLKSLGKIQYDFDNISLDEFERQGILFSSGPTTPDNHEDYRGEDEFMSMSPISFEEQGKGDTKKKKKHYLSEVGVRIDGDFIPLRLLRDAVTDPIIIDGGMKPHFVIVRDHVIGKIEHRVYERIWHLDKTYLLFMIRKCNENIRDFVKQGLTISCPKKTIIRPRWERLYYYVKGCFDFSDHEVEEEEVELKVVDFDRQGLSEFVQASYVGFATLELLGQQFPGMNVRFVLSSIKLLDDLVNCTSAPSGAIAMHHYYMCWQSEFDYFDISDFGEEGDYKRQGLFSNETIHRVIEGVAIVAACRMLNITKDLADFKSMGAFIKDNIITTSKNIVDVIFAVIKVLSSGNYENFLEKVSKTAFDADTFELSTLNNTYEILKNRTPDIKEFKSVLIQYYLLEEKIRKIEKNGKDYNRKIVEEKAKLLLSKVGATLKEFEVSADASMSRKEPVMLFCRSMAGTGKTIVGTAMQNAVARALKIDPDEIKHLTGVWSPSEEFQSGVKNHTAVVFIDEFGSVETSVDKNLSTALYNILQLGSSRAMPIPHANLEDKGRHSTKNMLGVVVNGNIHNETIKKVYSQEGENFFRRMICVNVIPKGAARSSAGQFRPDNAKGLTYDYEGLKNSLHIEAFYFKPTGEKGDIVYNGDILGFTDLLTKMIEERVDGKFAKIGLWLNSLLSYKIDKKESQYIKQSITIEVPFSFNTMIYMFLIYKFLEMVWIWCPPKVKVLYYWYQYKFVLEGILLRLNFVRSYVGIALEGGSIRARIQYARSREMINRFKWDEIRRRATLILEHPMVKALVGSLIFVGVMNTAANVVHEYREYAYGVARSKGDDSWVPKWEVQGFKMPTDVPPSEHLPQKVVQFMDKSVPILDLPIGTPTMQSLISYGGSMTINELDRIRSNYAAVLAESVDGKCRNAMYGTRIGQTILSCGHLLPVEGDYVITARSLLVSNQATKIVFKNNDLLREIGKEFCLIPNLLPAGVGDIRRCLKYTGPPIAIGDRVRMVYPRVGDDKFGVIHETDYTEEWPPGCGKFFSRLTVKWDDGNTSNGDCGLWIVRDVGSNRYQPIGLLIGGHKVHKNFSLITPILAKDVEVITGYAPHIKLDSSMWHLQGSLDVSESVPDIVHGQTPRGLFRYPILYKNFGVSVIGVAENQTPPSGSNLKKSPFYDIGQNQFDKLCPEVKYFPAVQETTIRFDEDMGANRMVSPYEVGMYRKDQMIIGLDYRRLVDFAHVFGENLSARIGEKVISCYSIDEALMRHDGLAPVDPRRAASMPEPGRKGAFMLEVNDEGGLKRFGDARLRADVRRLMGLYALGYIGFGFSKTSLKDEVLDIKKIEAVKTRLFESVMFTIYMMMRMIFGQFIPLILRATRSFGVCIGINASSKDWNWVHYRTDPRIHGGVLTDGDISRMDKNMLYTVQCVVYTMLLNIFKKVLDKDLVEPVLNIAVSLFWCELQVIRLVDGTYVLSYAGNCSGSFWTTITNSLVLIIYIYLSYAKIFPEISAQQFIDNVLAHMCVYGDDLRLLMVPRYNTSFEILQKMMATIGQEMTSGGLQKSAIQVETGGGKTFLKRGFRVCGDRVYCPLEIASLLKSLLYYEPSGERRQDNIRHMAVISTLWEEAFFHEEDVKNRLRNICKVCVSMIPVEFHRKFVSDAELEVRWENGLFKVWEL